MSSVDRSNAAAQELADAIAAAEAKKQEHVDAGLVTPSGEPVEKAEPKVVLPT